MSRTDERKDFELPVRVRLVEKDIDIHDQDLQVLRTELRAIRNVLIGILVSVTTASILLVINVMVIGGK